jgi:hypothetical protein
MPQPVPAYVPVTAGAIAATAVALLVGWPGQPPVTETAAVAAAAASAVVAVLLIVTAAARRPAQPGRAPATPTSAVRSPVEAADAMTEPIEVVLVGPAATNARSADSSSSSSQSVAGEPCRKAVIDSGESTLLPAVDHSTDRNGFRKLIDERTLLFARLPAGQARDLAARANESVGRGDGALDPRAEHDALFDLLAEGATTVPEAALATYPPVLLDKDALCAEPMYVVDVEGGPQDAPTLKHPVTAAAGEKPAPLSPQGAERGADPAPEASGEVLAEASSQATARKTPSNARQQAEQVGPAPAPDARREAETSAPAQGNGRALAAPDPLAKAPAPAALGPQASAAVPDKQHVPHAVPAPSAAPSPVAPSDAAPAPHPPTNENRPIPTPARLAGRAPRTPMATRAQQAAADLAFLRTFGVRPPTPDEPEIAFKGRTPDDDQPLAGTAQPVTVHVLTRDGNGIPGATVALLDDHGRETSNTCTTRDGHGVLTARHPGGHILVITADGYQPGAITVAVADGPVDAEIPLTRSASLAGTVGGEDGPVVGAQLALVQDGAIVDTVKSGPDGTYRFRDLSLGEYGLSVSAHEREPAALVVQIADEADLRQDVELPPAGRGRAAPHRSRPSASCSRSTAEGASSSGSSSVPFRYTSPPEPIQRGEATTGSGLIERGGYVATTGIACHRAGSRQDPTSTGPRLADQQHDPAA